MLAAVVMKQGFLISSTLSHYNKKAQTKHENYPGAETKQTDIFCLFFPPLAQMITAPSAAVTLLQGSAQGVKLRCDETQLSVKKKKKNQGEAVECGS